MPAPITPIIKSPGYVYDSEREICWNEGESWFPPIHHEIPMSIGFENSYQNLPDYYSDEVTHDPLNSTISFQPLTPASSAFLLLLQAEDFILRFPIKNPAGNHENNLFWGFDVTYNRDDTMTVGNFFIRTTYPDANFSHINIGSNRIWEPMTGLPAIMTPEGYSVRIDRELTLPSLPTTAEILIICNTCGPGNSKFPWISQTTITGFSKCFFWIF